jgi:transposase-like protein
MRLPTAAQLRRDEKRKAACRMYAQGRGRTDIAQFLHVSGGVVKKYLTEPAK